MPGLAVQAREWSLGLAAKAHNGSRLCAPRAVAITSPPRDSGRDGQIRTADLSLRRRPLYPSELRPRGYSSILSMRLGERLQVSIIEFHTVIERADPHPLIFAVRPNVVLIQRDARNPIARYTGRDGIDAVRGPGLHLRNYRRTGPHPVGHALQWLHYLSRRQHGGESLRVRSAIENGAGVVYIFHDNFRIREATNQFLSHFLAGMPRYDATIHDGLRLLRQRVVRMAGVQARGD